jgi:hypothetical protein
MPEESVQKSSIITTSGSGGNRLPKIVLILLVFFVLAVGAEVIYFFYSRNAIQKQTPIETVENVDNGETFIPQPTKFYNVEKAKELVAQFESLEAKQEFFEVANAVFVVSGTVSTIGPTQVEKGRQMVDRYEISISSGSGEVLSFYLDNTELKNASVILNSNQTNKIPVTQIREGDGLRVNMGINLLDSSPYYNLVFEVTR